MIELVGHDGKVISPSTTTGFDSTGATLLIIIAHYYVSPDPYSFSDSYGNTWHQRTIYGASEDRAHIVLAYAYDKAGAPLSLGAGHTFTIGAALYQSLTVTAWKGTLAGLVDSYYAENGESASGSSPRQPGSITPFAAGDLIISGCAEGNSFSYGPSVAPVAWAITDAVYDGLDMGGGHAYLVSPDGAAVNPTWTWTSSTDLICNIATFKAAAAGGGLSIPVAMAGYMRRRVN